MLHYSWPATHLVIKRRSPSVLDVGRVLRLHCRLRHDQPVSLRLAGVARVHLHGDGRHLRSVFPTNNRVSTQGNNLGIKAFLNKYFARELTQI